MLLTPVVMTGEGDGPMGQAPMSFFAPNAALAVGRSPLAASQELKHVVKELHAHGIEVILQVYCTPNLPVSVCFVLHMCISAFLGVVHFACRSQSGHCVGDRTIECPSSVSSVPASSFCSITDDVQIAMQFPAIEQMVLLDKLPYSQRKLSARCLHLSVWH